MAYSDLLKHPKWQKKRLEILNRDEFTCQGCRAKDKPLHVHHVDYFVRKKPWEYPDYILITYCDDCHKKWHSIEAMNKSDFLELSLRSIYEKMESNQILSDYDVYEFTKELGYINSEWCSVSERKKLFITSSFPDFLKVI